MGNITYGTKKELSLQEWVERLPEGHSAREEYKKILVELEALRLVKEALKNAKP